MNAKSIDWVARASLGVLAAVLFIRAAQDHSEDRLVEFLILTPFTVFVLYLVFHADVFLIFALCGVSSWRSTHTRIRPKEKILKKTRFTSGILGTPGIQIRGLLYIILTDQRLVVRFVSSFPGLALLDVRLENIVVIGRTKGVLTGPGYELELKGSYSPMNFILRSTIGDGWREAFRTAGVATRCEL